MDAQLVDKLNIEKIEVQDIPERTLDGYAVDFQGVTIHTFTPTKKRDLAGCLRFARALKAQNPGSKIRPFKYDEQALHRENSINRDWYRWNNRVGGFATKASPCGKNSGLKVIVRKKKEPVGNIAKTSLLTVLDKLRVSQ